MLIGETQGTPIYLISGIHSRIKGYYVFSSSDVKCIPQELEQILGLEEFEEEIETEFELILVNYGLLRAVYRYDLERAPSR